MTPYRKRAKSGWEGGKDYKHKSNRSERGYAKSEVREALNSHHGLDIPQDETPAVSTELTHDQRQANKSAAKLAREVAKCEKQIARTKKYMRLYDGIQRDWFVRYQCSLRSDLKKYEEKLAKLQKRDK